MNRPQVSVIVPNYNHSKFLEQRLDSIFNQSFQDFEVILLDDSSTDRSVEILNKYASDPRVTHYVINEQNSGSTFKQWDKGINLAKGVMIWIAETDDFCENDFLEKMLNFYDKHQGVSLLYCQSHRMSANGELTGNWISHTGNFKPNIFHKDFVMDGNLFIEKYLIHKNVIPNVSAVLIKREAIKKITPLKFYPYMKYNADWFYYIQLLCNSKVGFLAESLNYFRYHDSSVIGKAGGESGWLKIFKMELKGREQMILYIENCRPENFEAIKALGKIGDEKLIYWTAEGFIERGNYLKGIFLVWNKPSLWRRTGRFLRRKIRSVI